MWSELAFSFKNLNVYTLSMVALTIFATGIFLERFFTLQFVYNLNARKFLQGLKKMIDADDRDRAINFSKSAGNSSLPLIASRALEASETDPTSVRGTIEEETIDFLPKIEVRTGVLPLIATIILLLGVLATIDGLWSLFHSVDVLDTAKKQVIISQGIASTLTPTALGLMVSIFILTGHHIVRSFAVRLTEKVHYCVTVLTNLLAPQTQMAMAPMAMHMDSGASDQSAEPTIEPQQDSNDGVIADDSFDDAAVEDIKDEEEII